MDTPTHWNGDAIDPPTSSALEGRLAAFETILAQAMAATCCAAAMICVTVDDGLKLIADNGEGPLRKVVPYRTNGSAPEANLQVLSGPPVAIGFRGEYAGDVGFAVAASIPGADGAFLIVLDTQPRLRLSPAQSYVLRSNAAHLATVLGREPINGIPRLELL